MTASLREIQEHFLSYVIKQENKILDDIETEQGNALERAEIYREGYFLRLLEILEKSFPVLYKIMGKELFDKFGRNYIDTFPSNDFNICHYAHNFPNYLQQQKQNPFWTEVGEFELALAQALDQADAPQIDMTALGGLSGEDWPNLQLELHPSVAFYQFKSNTPQIVLAHLLEQDIPDLITADEPKNWMVWRLNLQSYYESVTKEQLWMLNNIAKGKTFGELCEGLCEWLAEEEVPQFAAGSLGNWLQKGIFSHFGVAAATETNTQVN